MRVEITTIPHGQQRYSTCGDWQWERDTLHIRVSELGDWRMEMAVATHELYEALTCRHAGVTEQQVDEFDFAYEATRPEGDVSEPGDAPSCPCYWQHQGAKIPEQLLLNALGVPFYAYEARINALG